MGQLVATLVVTWFLAMRAGLTRDMLSDIALTGWALNWVLLGASCVLLAIGYAVTGLLWRRIVRDLGGPVISSADSVRLFMIANLGRYVPGKVWQIAGLAALGRSRGVPPVTAAGAAVLGQGVALLAAATLGLYALAGWAPAPWATVTPILGLCAIGILLWPPAFRRAAAFWFRISRTDPVEGLRPAAALQWLGVALFNWVLFVTAFWVLVRGLGLTGSLPAIGSAFAAAYVLGYVMIFAPAGIGVREGFLIALLAPYFGPAEAGAVAVVARLWTTLVEIVPAATFWARHLALSDGAGSPGA